MPATEVDRLRRKPRRGSKPRVREAGALALSMFRKPLKSWTKGESHSPVTEADIAVDNLLRERLTAERPASPGCRRKASTIRCGLTRATSGSSIRSTARAPISPACRNGRCRRRSSRTAGRSRPASMRRRCEEFFFAIAGARRDAQRRRDRRQRRDRASTKRASPVRKNMLERLASRRSPPFTTMPRVHSLALRLHPRRPGRLRHRLCRRQQPRLGPCGGRSFGARSGRRDDAVWRAEL